MSDREFSARCEFIRNTFEKLLHWFTAFIAVNIVAIGWIVTEDQLTRTTAIAVSIFMAVQCLLGFIGTRMAQRSLMDSSARVDQLLLPNEKSPVPADLYSKSCKLICMAQMSSMAFWLALPFVRSFG